MKKVYLVYAYYTDIQRNVMMTVCSSMKKAKQQKETLLRFAREGKIEHLHDVTIQKEYVH